MTSRKQSLSLPDNMGSAELVPIADVNVDIAYQRSLRHDLVNEIGNTYNAVKAGPILVSKRTDDTMWCVDGQHRMAGAEQAGQTHIFAHVVHGLTMEQEAELRLARNNRRSDSIMERFRTRLAMGDPLAHAIVEVVHQNGSTVNLSPQTYTGINAVNTLEALYKLDSKGVILGRTLRLINEAYGEITPITASSPSQKATAWFLGQHVDTREANWSELVQRLGAAGIDDVRRKAISHKAANGGSLWINQYRAIVEIWNFRRQDQNKLLWRTVGSIASLGAEGTSGQGKWSNK